MNNYIAVLKDELIYAEQLDKILNHWAKQLNCTLSMLHFKSAADFLKTDFNLYDVAF